MNEITNGNMDMGNAFYDDIKGIILDAKICFVVKGNKIGKPFTVRQSANICET